MQPVGEEEAAPLAILGQGSSVAPVAQPSGKMTVLAGGVIMPKKET
jgi:hypothetical protein